jgi:hypothetical protein
MRSAKALQPDRGTLAALEKAKTEKEAHGEFENEHAAYCGAQDTFSVSNLKGVVGKPSSTPWLRELCKTPITAADLLNDRVVPFFNAP